MSLALRSEPGTTVDLLDNWFDGIEVGLHERVREFIQAMIESELDTALARRPTVVAQSGVDRKLSAATATVTARDH
jgi:hypothetical protein